MTCPLPLPLAPPVTVIHEVLVDAFHVHPLAALTDTMAEPAVALRVALTGESPYEQAPASCVTVRARPAMFMVPVLAVVPVCAATAYPMDPEPLPLAPDVTGRSMRLRSTLSSCSQRSW